LARRVAPESVERAREAGIPAPRVQQSIHAVAARGADL